MPRMFEDRPGDDPTSHAPPGGEGFDAVTARALARCGRSVAMLTRDYCEQGFYPVIMTFRAIARPQP